MVHVPVEAVVVGKVLHQAGEVAHVVKDEPTVRTFIFFVNIKYFLSKHHHSISLSQWSWKIVSLFLFWDYCLLSSKRKYPKEIMLKKFTKQCCLVKINRYYIFFLVIPGARLSRTPSLSRTLDTSLRPGGRVWGCLGSKLLWNGTGIQTLDLLLESQEFNRYATGPPLNYILIIRNTRKTYFLVCLSFEYSPQMVKGVTSTKPMSW